MTCKIADLRFGDQFRREPREEAPVYIYVQPSLFAGMHAVIHTTWKRKAIMLDNDCVVYVNAVRK